MSVKELDPSLQEKPVTKPPTRWHNWWRAKVSAIVVSASRPQVVEPETLLKSEENWPTHELAEQSAAECATRMGIIEGRSAYLGAHPEGERP